MTQQSFMRGAVVLGAASTATTVLGMVIQVVVARELGPAGFGLFGAVNPIFFMILTIATLALPSALSKVVAENLATGNYVKIRRAVVLSHVTVIVLSIVVCSIALLFAPTIADRWLDPRALVPLIGAILRIPLICLYSVMTGFYMGIQQQAPPAVAWIIETVVRMFVTIPLILYMNQFGIAYGALAVMIGGAIGDLSGYFYLQWHYRRNERPWLVESVRYSSEGGPEGCVRDLAQMAVPTTVGNISDLIFYTLEPIVIYMAFAHVGISKIEATALYGSFGMALQLLTLPAVLSSSLCNVVLPAVSEAAARGATRLVARRVSQVLQLTFLVALPATVFFILSGHDVASTLYNDPIAGTILAYIAPICVFIYMRDPVSAILQGMNRPMLSTLISVIAGAVRILLMYYFVSHLVRGIIGVAEASAIAAVIATVIGFFFIYPYIQRVKMYKQVAKIIIASALASIPIHQIHAVVTHQMPTLHVIGSVVVGCLVYAIALVYLKVVSVYTIQRIPWVGQAVAAMVQRMPYVSRF